MPPSYYPDSRAATTSGLPSYAHAGQFSGHFSAADCCLWALQVKWRHPLCMRDKTRSDYLKEKIRSRASA